MTRERKEEMMDNIIKKFGHEDIHSIIFCGMCETNTSETIIYETYDDYMGYGLI